MRSDSTNLGVLRKDHRKETLEPSSAFLLSHNHESAICIGAASV